MCKLWFIYNGRVFGGGGIGGSDTDNWGIEGLGIKTCGIGFLVIEGLGIENCAGKVLGIGVLVFAPCNIGVRVINGSSIVGSDDE